MTKFLKYCIGFIVALAFVYQFLPQVDNYFAPVVEYVDHYIPPAPCTHPIPYVLGTFDTEFNISQADFLQAVAEAEAIWEKPIGRNLFEYEPGDTAGGVLKINLVYDNRQEVTDKSQPLQAAVQSNQDAYDAMNAKYAALKNTYTSDLNSFNSAVDAFNQKNQAYQAEVAASNSQGGASPSEYSKLQQERSDLATESDQLQTEQGNLNTELTQINSMVAPLNSLTDAVNAAIKNYNAENASLGNSFDQGLYESDGGSINNIYIYEFKNHTDLVQVLAHELGHALGLSHVKDPKAIMYADNGGTSTKLAPDDLAELDARCGIK